MNGTDALLTLAEIGLGFAGFTAVVVSFTRRPAELDPAERIRLLVLLVASLGVVLLALLPLVLSYLGVSSSTLWRTSSGLMFLYGIGAWTSFVLTYRAIDPAARRVLSLPLLVFAITGTIASLAPQLLVCLGFFGAGLGVYFAGLFWFLILASIQFGRIVFVRPSQS